MQIPQNAKILFDKKTIQRRIGEVAIQAREFCLASGGEDVEIIWLAEGARFFAEAILSRINLNVKARSVKVSSYHNGTKSSGEVKIFGGIEGAVAPRVLLIDDILDTGLTAKTVIEKLREGGAREIKTCFLLNKISKNGGEPKADFECFEIPDKYVFGCGMDYKGFFRELEDLMFIE
ncbi:MAG: hypothetical protein IKO42_04335 [Opitutales bacterium]|nr:hypothetical protein [Opitutales bacterium]